LSWLGARTGKRLWVERSGSSLGFLAPMFQLFPNARYVHMWRDGREMAVSASKFPPMRLSMINRDFQALVGKSLYEAIPAERVGKLPEPYRPLVAPHFDVDAYQRVSLPVARFGETWSNMLCRGLPLLARLPPERVLHVRYESVLADPHAELRRFIEFLDPGLEREDWVREAARLVRPNPPKWTKLPAEERARLEAACAPGEEALAKLGISAGGTGATATI
jgi:putative sulfotransferase